MALATESLRAAERVMPPYSHKFSPKKYTQHQLFAILLVRQFLGRDYRGITHGRSEDAVLPLHEFCHRLLAVPRELFGKILERIGRLRLWPG